MLSMTIILISILSILLGFSVPYAFYMGIKVGRKYSEGEVTLPTIKEVIAEEKEEKEVSKAVQDAIKELEKEDEAWREHLDF